MAVTYGFYNALNHDRVYDAIQMSSIFDGIIRDGVFSTIGESLICKASESGLVVNVGAGRAWFDHTWTLNDTDYPVEAEQAEVVLDRIDAIVLEVNSAVEVRANTIKFIKGTPSANPVRPTLVHNAEVNQYALAYVNIRAGQTTIFQSDITNVVGSDETPFITGLLQQLSIEQIVLQWEDEFDTWMRDNNVAYTEWTTTMQNQFNSWMNTKMNEYAQWYGHMQEEGAADLAEFDAWFQHMKDQLDEDAAGHLQAEIDALAQDAEKGSIVRVTTTDDTLINKTVTIVQNEQSLSTTFSAEKIADFPSVPMIGDMRITSSNGVLTAIKDINIPYFGRYTYNLEFWEATLNIVSGDSGLYGRAVYISKGGTVVGSTVFDNTGHATYKVHEAGTYTISCTSTGGTTYEETVEVTDETVYEVSMGLPDGSTVTPVNDIQTWLKCAGLDTNYTTLAEVLADTSTFDTLLRDSNACNYMARSTGWAAGKGEGLVPQMTSATTPSGSVTASSYYDANYLPYQAFDGLRHDGWLTGNGQVANSWIQYEFAEAVKVNAVHIREMYFAPRGDSEYAIQNYKIQASADGTNFTTLYTGVNSGREEVIEVSINNNSAYKYYRIVIVDTFGGVYSGFREVQFYANPLGLIVDTEEPMARIGKYNYCSEMLLANETWRNAIASSKYVDEILNVSVPKKTSLTSDIIYSSTLSSDVSPYKAFDGDDGSLFLFNVGNITTNYIGYNFNKKVKLTKLSLVVGKTGSPASPLNLKLQASNDGTTWYDLETLTSHSSSFTEDYVFDISESYSQYRLFTSNITFPSNNNHWNFRTIQFYCREEAAFNYTPLVPAMTSDTTPSGEVIYSSEYPSEQAYKAFDGDNSTNYSASSESSNEEFIGYKFETPTRVDSLVYKSFNQANCVNTWEVEYSDDNVTWTSTGITFKPTSPVEVHVEIPNQIAHLYWRIRTTQRDSASYKSTTLLQFYSKSIKQIIHSCPNSAVYYKEGGNDITLCETDATGLAEVDWTIFPHGNVTLYSTVAKDPDNLSNDYSKTVFITNTSKGHTTELYLMPDPVKTLYWYGYESKNLEDCTTANGWTPYVNSFVNPIHGTNKIRLSANGGSGTYSINCAIGTKNIVKNVTELHAIIQRMNSMTYSGVVIRENKNVGQNAIFGCNAPSNTLSHISGESQTPVDGYIDAWDYNSGVTEVHAMWYN